MRVWIGASLLVLLMIGAAATTPPAPTVRAVARASSHLWLGIDRDGREELPAIAAALRRTFLVSIVATALAFAAALALAAARAPSIIAAATAIPSPLLALAALSLAGSGVAGSALAITLATAPRLAITLTGGIHAHAFADAWQAAIVVQTSLAFLGCESGSRSLGALLADGLRVLPLYPALTIGPALALCLVICAIRIAATGLPRAAT